MIAIDLSLRSSGLVALDKEDNLIDFDVVQPCEKEYRQDYNAEETLIYISDKVLDFVKRVNDTDAVVIEGLSFQSTSSAKDFIWGNFWNLRTQLRMLYPEMLIGVIPVLSWRSPLLSHLTKEERKKLKKDIMKQFCVDLLPLDVYNRFNKFILINNLDKKTMFDLTDAYFLCKFRNTLTKG